MEAKDIKWCPQHGYPLPCHKCGMPLSQPQQKEIYGEGKKAGIKEVVEADKTISQHILQDTEGNLSIESRWLKSWLYERKTKFQEWEIKEAKR